MIRSFDYAELTSYVAPRTSETYKVARAAVTYCHSLFVAATMSYVRLLRLPTQWEAAGTARCSRTYSSAGSGGAKRRVDRKAQLLQHRSSSAGYDVSHNAGGATELALPSNRCVQPGGTLAGDVVWGLEKGDGRTCTLSKIASPCALQRRGASDGITRLPSSSGMTPSASGAPPIRMFAGSAGGGTWSQQQVQWQIARGFASTPPEQPDSKADVADKSGRRALPGQRAYLGGLLKPSDVSMLCVVPLYSASRKGRRSACSLPCMRRGCSCAPRTIRFEFRS